MTLSIKMETRVVSDSYSSFTATHHPPSPTASLQAGERDRSQGVAGKGAPSSSVYSLAVTAAGLLAVGFVGYRYGLVLTPLMGVLAMLCIVSEWLVIRMPQGDSVTTSFVLVLLALLVGGPLQAWGQPPVDSPLGGPIAAMQTIALGSLIGYGVLRRQSPSRFLFYSSQYVLASGLAGALYAATTAWSPSWGLQTVHLPAVAVYLVSYSLLSQGLVGLRNRITIATAGEKLPRTDLLTAFILAPLPLLMYYLYTIRNWSALLFVLFPLLAVLAAFRLYINIDTAYNEVKVLYQISQRFTAALSQEETVRTVARGIARSLEELIEYDRCLLYSLDEEENTFLLANVEEGEDWPERMFMGQGLLGQVAASGQGRIINDMERELKAMGEEKTWPTDVALLVAPLTVESIVVGLIVLTRRRSIFNAEHFRLISILANQAGVMLKNAQLYEKSQHMAETDRLLGLMNRYAFHQHAQQEISRAQQDGRPAAMIMTDIDDFRVINNTFGHQVGDVVLQGVAELLKQIVGKKGVVARYGGEEFIILLPGMDESRARPIAESIRQAIEQRHFPAGEGQVTRATASLGVVLFPKDARDVAGLIKKADRAAYLAKRLGKNRVCLYEDRPGSE